MLAAGILNPLLVRMDLSYGTQSYCLPPSDVPPEGVEHSEDTMLLIINVLWALMRSILPPRSTPDNVRQLPALPRCSMWGLRCAFKRYVRTSHRSARRLKIRNGILGFILAGLVALPAWNIVNCGIADDVIFLLSASENTLKNTWLEAARFATSNDDLILKNTLLLIACRLTKIGACTFIFSERMAMSAVLRLVHSNAKESSIEAWSDSQFRFLSERAMYTLTLLTRKIPQEFIKYHGTYRLLEIVKKCFIDNFDLSLATTCAKTICFIVIQQDCEILCDFKKHGMVVSLIDIIVRILDMEMMGRQYQRLLTFLLVAANILLKEQLDVAQNYGEQSMKIVDTILVRSFNRKVDQFKVDQRLLLAVGFYIWGSIISCPRNIINFVKEGAIHALLDIVEEGEPQVRCLYLGVLADICDSTFCGSYLCTWRGIDKEKGFVSLLAEIWRAEEKRVGVKRTEFSTLQDVKLPLMGNKQYKETYKMILTTDSSPAMSDMLGSVRPRIYSIRRIIQRHRETYNMAKERYKILLCDLPVEDRLTMLLVDQFLRLKLGEVWIEINRYFEQEGLIPISMDRQLLYLTIQRHFSLASYIHDRQMDIVREFQKTEFTAERIEYVRICDSKLPATLDALKEIEFIRRTTDRSYSLRRRELKKRQLKSSISRPLTGEIHRTYQENIAMDICGKNFVVDVDFNEAEIAPVSPTVSDDSIDELRVSLSDVSISSKCLLIENDIQKEDEPH